MSAEPLCVANICSTRHRHNSVAHKPETLRGNPGPAIQPLSAPAGRLVSGIGRLPVIIPNFTAQVQRGCSQS